MVMFGGEESGWQKMVGAYCEPAIVNIMAEVSRA